MDYVCVVLIAVKAIAAAASAAGFTSKEQLVAFTLGYASGKSAPKSSDEIKLTWGLFCYHDSLLSSRAPLFPICSQILLLMLFTSYFGGPGRGELIRLIFKAGNVKFTDIRVAFGTDAWPKMKSDPTSLAAKLWGFLPVLEHGDCKLAHSR